MSRTRSRIDAQASLRGEERELGRDSGLSRDLIPVTRLIGFDGPCDDKKARESRARCKYSHCSLGLKSNSAVRRRNGCRESAAALTSVGWTSHGHASSCDLASCRRATPHHGRDVNTAWQWKQGYGQVLLIFERGKRQGSTLTRISNLKNGAQYSVGESQSPPSQPLLPRIQGQITRQQATQCQRAMFASSVTEY